MLENQIYYIMAVRGYNVEDEKGVTDIDSDNYYCETKEQALDCIEHCLLSRKYISINVSIQDKDMEVNQA